MEIRFIHQAIALVLLASSITAIRVNHLRHRKRGILNHPRFSAYSIGHPAPPVPLTYALRHGGASVASYSATYPRFRKIVLQAPVAVGQRPVHFDDGYVNVVRPTPVYIQRPTPVYIQRPVYPVAVQNPGSYYPGNVGTVYPSVDLHPSTVIADTPHVVGYPGHPGFVPLSPRPVVETPQYVPQYPSIVSAQVPSALRPGHVYPANTLPGNPVVPAVPVLPPVSSGNRPFYTLRPGVFPTIPGIYSVNPNEGGSVSSQPRPDSQHGQTDYEPQYPSEESYPTTVHHNQQPDTAYYTPTSTGSGTTSGADSSAGGQGSTSQQSPWTPMHPVDDSTTDYHQVAHASTPAISLLPPYHTRYQLHQAQQEQRYSAQDDYADY